MKPLDLFLSQVFLSLETFLQKATTLNIFEALIFNYKIKVNSVEQCSPQFLSIVVELCNELQLVLKESIIADEYKKLTPVEEDGRSPIQSTFCEPQQSQPKFDEYTSVLSNSQVSEPERKDQWESISSQSETTDEIPEQVRKKLLLNKEKAILTCKFCHRKYRTNGRLSKHVCKSVQSVSNKLRDEESIDDPDSDLSERLSQMDCEVELPVFMCVGCLCTFSQRHQFDQHSHSENMPEAELVTDVERLQKERKFCCGSCREVYRSLSRITYHLARCSGGPYQCELCPHLASSRHLLNRHKKRHHKGVECFFCSECGLGFKLRTSLQKHLVNRHETHQNHFPCDFNGCSKTFVKKIHLTNHKIEIHGVERKYLCQVCGHKFMTPESLSCHLEFHNNKNRFQCRFCSKMFKTKEKMVLHERTHTGEKPFVCDTAGCCKSFVSKSKLIEHLKRHNGEKPHKCMICNKQYANKQDLRLHLRKIHQIQETEEKSKTGKSSTDVSLTATELPMITAEIPRELPPEPAASLDLYPSQVILQVDNTGSQLYSNMQFYQEPGVQLVTVPQNMVVTSYDTIIGM